MHIRRVCVTAGVLAIWIWKAIGLPQEPTNKFTLRLGRGGIAGSEEYRIDKTDIGYRLTGRTRLDVPGKPIEMSQEQTLRADWGFQRYRLEASVAGQTQLIEAWRDGEQVQMRLSAGGQTRNNATPLHPNILVLDNLVASHYQILLNLTKGKVEGSQELPVLVPQQLAALRAKVAEAQAESGTLAGQAIQVKKIPLEVGNVLIELWAEAETNRLMRVYVPVQDVEQVREGFSLTTKAAPEMKPQLACVERTLTFPSGGLQMPGTLTLPIQVSRPVPMVILVHGSGPNDRDETIGPNKPFRDLAHGLASTGIAALRYDKRTFAFRQQIDAKSMTVEQEVVDDAVAALNHARTLPEINSEAIFLLGHSLGGAMAPYIAKRFSSLRGVILMAAAVRPLDELIYEQAAFGMRVAGLSETDIAQKVKELKAAFARVRSGQAPDDEAVFFASARYWRDLFRLNVQAAMADLKLPVLVLQGGKDVQVTKVDYDLIAQALAAVPPEGREMHWFPNLNHLFMPVAGQPTGAEYGRAGQVDQEVIDTIVVWIRKQMARR